MTIDNCLEALLPVENIKKRKMRNRMKKKIIDYQTNKEETTDWKICGQLSRDNCQLTKCPQDPIAFKLYELYELSTNLIERFLRCKKINLTDRLLF